MQFIRFTFHLTKIFKLMIRGKIIKIKKKKSTIYIISTNYFFDPLNNKIKIFQKIDKI